MCICPWRSFLVSVNLYKKIETKEQKSIKEKGKMREGEREREQGPTKFFAAYEQKIFHWFLPTKFAYDFRMIAIAEKSNWPRTEVIKDK